MTFDRETVLFGAATHDIGKVVHPEELSSLGTQHEQAGHYLLLNRGVENRLTSPTEDLLVSLADRMWRSRS